MNPSSLLDLAAELLREVLKFEQPADRIVSAYFARHRALGQRERHAMAETTYGVLRQRLLLQHLALSGSGSLERRLAILGWQGADTALAAAMRADESEWRARALAVDRSALAEPLRHNLPPWLADALQAEVGDEFWPLVNALNASAPLDLRVNTFKVKREAALAELAREGIEALPTRYSPWGLRIDGKPALNRLPIFQRGDIEVQDEGSQLLALLVDARRGEMVVDFCAGAGGKTLALGAAMRNTGRLYAFDVSGHRLAALKPRLARSGLSNVHPVQIAHERDDRIKRLAGKIDRVLVDAPCSGLGTLRRNPDLKWRQTPASVLALHTQQLAILTSAARLLKIGGRLVYATCSLLAQENQAVADAFNTTRKGEFTPVSPVRVLASSAIEAAPDMHAGEAVQFWPHRHETDGFFATVWERA
jgi:16S rRNA (cytosine967-C5)-methyltransferase